MPAFRPQQNFDGLAPTTTKGDLITRSTTTNVRIAVGTDGQFLKADSSTSSGLAWGNASGQLAVTSKTANYTAATSDDVILCSGAAFTVTLYAASGNTGRTIRIMKTDSTLANIITIDGNASETINGATTTTLNTQYEEVTLVCDGSNWFILNRAISSPWVLYVATITGFGTVTGLAVYSRRVGDSLQVRGRFQAGTVAASEASITLGFNGTDGGLTIDTTKINTSKQMVGHVGIDQNSTTYFTAEMVYGTTTLVYFGIQNSTNPAINTPTNGNVIAGNSNVLSFFFEVPIDGWKG